MKNDYPRFGPRYETGTSRGIEAVSREEWLDILVEALVETAEGWYFPNRTLTRKDALEAIAEASKRALKDE